MKLFKKSKNFKITIEIDGDKVSFESKDLFDDKTNDSTLDIERNKHPMSLNTMSQMLEIRISYLINELLKDPDEFAKKTKDQSIEMARKSGIPEEIIKMAMKGDEKQNEDTKTTLH